MMLLSLHILFALSGVAASTFAVVRPSTATIKSGAALVILTLTSGSVLIAENHTHMLSACVSGLAYLGFTTAALATSRYRLARVAVKVRNK